MDRRFDVTTFISKYLYLIRPRVANFAVIFKVGTAFIKKTFKDSKKVKTIINYALKH